VRGGNRLRERDSRRELHRRDAGGTVPRERDDDREDRRDRRRAPVERTGGLGFPNGLAIRRGWLYVAETLGSRVSRLRMNADGTLGSPEVWRPWPAGPTGSRSIGTGTCSSRASARSRWSPRRDGGHDVVERAR
jgi:hypothetical protein